MKLPCSSVLSFLTRWFVGGALALVWNAAQATPPDSVVVYDPASQSIYGTLPVSQTNTLKVTCPGAVTTFPVTVTLRVTANQPPLGDVATALSYVSLSSPTLTFTSAGQQQSVQVTVSMPSTALNANVPAGSYTYLINTDGWPAGITDQGSTINAQVQMPGAPTGNPPTVAITSPGNYATLSYEAGTFPQTVGFSFTGTTDASSPAITQLGATFGTPTNMAPVTVASTGLGTATVTGTGNITFPGPGTYKLSASATNPIGTSSDEHTITVNVAVPPPTVQITSPTQNPPTTYTYRVGDPALDVPFTFVATTTYGGIADLTATVDGKAQTFTTTGLNTLSATATVHLRYDTASAQGTHTLSVTATDVYGQPVTTTGSFSINYVGPNTQVAIQTPTPAKKFYIPEGALTADVPYQFTTTVTNNFVVDSVAAAVNGTVLSPATTGLGSASATSSGIMTLAPGTYQLVASGTSTGQNASASVSFSVVAGAEPPGVVINSPANGSQTLLAPGTTATIPFQFTGTSNNPGSVITAMTATLDGAPIAFNCTTYGQPVAVGTATLSLNTTKTYTLVVTATDDAGTATATSAFTIAPMPPHAIDGTVFFDVDGDGAYDPLGYDYGLAGVLVSLRDASGVVIGLQATNVQGRYSFTGLFPGSYTITAVPSAGLQPTTATREEVQMTAPADVAADPIGLGLDVSDLGSMTATGYTIGYWKNNVEKAIAGKTGGVQVSAATIGRYTSLLGAFALNPFDGLTEDQAVAIMGSTSSTPADLLAKQLLAAEYNYQNGAYLSGNAPLTLAFVYWGEYVLSHSSVFTDAYIIWVKDWFDAYNNSHGGKVSGPGSFTGTVFNSAGSSGTETVTSSPPPRHRRK